MTETTVILLENETKLECNAFSLILYDDTFKRNFFRDYADMCSTSDNAGGYKIGNYVRFLWTFAKTANPDFMNFESFSKKCNIAGVAAYMNIILKLISDSLGHGDDDPKEEAAEQ